MKYFIRLWVLALLLSACGGQSSASSTSTSDITVSSVEESTKDMYKGAQEEKGTGTMYIVTDGGSTEDGIVPVLYVEEEDLMVSIELDAWDYDGKHLSFIYVDGVLNEKEQLKDVQMTLMLSGNELTEGVHKVQVVQYEDDDPKGSVLSYHAGSYEVKIIK